MTGYFTVIVLLAWAWAWHNRFILDDAFISFRYSQHLAEGQGLVYNTGERVEGYTNFLWTMWMTVPFLADWNPVFFSWATGLLLFPLSLGLTFHIAYRLSGCFKTALLAMGLTGFHFSYSAFATSGLETHAQSFSLLLVVSLLLKSIHRPSSGLALAISLVSAAAFMTRMDSAVLLLPVYLALFWRIRHCEHHQRLMIAACALLPAMVLVGTWLIWKISYYGHIFPNTFFVKTSGPIILPGLYYVFLYFISYGLGLLFVITFFMWWRHRPPHQIIRTSDLSPSCVSSSIARPGWYVLLGVCAGWIVYLIAVGGDFMEFRMMMPIVPFLFVLAADSILRVFHRNEVRFAWIIALILISGIHPHRTRIYGVETVAGMKSNSQAALWIEVGQVLHELIGDTDVVIAVTPAGAIPFYSRLPTIDMLGLNDVWIARNGLPTENPARRWLGEKPGHRIKAPTDYLVKQGTNLLIGHPLVRDANGPRRVVEDYIGSGFAELDRPPPQYTRVIEIPLNSDRVLVALYIQSHPAIDHLLASEGWRVYTLHTGVASEMGM